jgi:hypothetical protein
MRGDPLRDQRSAAARLHLPLYGMPTPDRQCVLMALVVAGTAFQLAGTQPRPLQRQADSGRIVTRWVCPDCGTWIWSGPKPDPATRDALRVRAGTLDDTSWLYPTAHFWTRSAQSWVVLPEGDQRFETQSDDLAWMRAGSA